MTNEVRPGMRFRSRFTGAKYTAKSESEGFWEVDEGPCLDLKDHGSYEPIPEPAPELCAWAPCAVGGPDCSKRAPGTKEQHDRRRLKFPFTHDFVAPQAKPVSAGAPQNVGSIGPAGELIPAKPVLREPKPCVYGCNGWIYSEMCGVHAPKEDTHPKGPAAGIAGAVRIAARQDRITASAAERGPSAVAAAPAIEPWRPTVDDDFWIPNASEGWRR